MWVAARCRLAAHVDEQINRMRLQQLDERVDGSRRMTDGVNSVRRIAAHVQHLSNLSTGG